MKRTIKTLVLLTVAVLLLDCAGAGSAEGGGISALWQSGYSLLCATDNATLTFHGVFSKDGKVFKTYDASMLKEGLRSFLQVDAVTPLSDGSERHGGYRVIGDDGVAWSYDLGDECYWSIGIDPSLSIIRSPELKQALRDLGGVISGIADVLLSGGIREEKTEAGTRYAFSVKEEQVPSLLQAALLPLMQKGSVQLGFGYVFAGEADIEQQDRIRYEDQLATMAVFYEQMSGDRMPDDFYNICFGLSEEAATPEMTALCVQILAKMEENESLLAMEHPEDVILIRKDGSVALYPTEEAFIIAHGLKEIHFQNWEDTFRVWYEKKTDTPLSGQELECILLSDNAELTNALWDMYFQMNDEYLQSVMNEPDAVAGYIRRNGTLTYAYDLQTYNYLCGYMSETEIILAETNALRLTSFDASALLDEQGRFLSAEGNALFTVTTTRGAEYPLAVSFNAAAGEYGTTDTSAYTPEMWGIPDSATWLPAWREAESNKKNELKTIIFNGTEYSL